jgi:uncharacterized protein
MRTGWLLAAVVGCAGKQADAPKPGTVAYDRSVFEALLRDHRKIRREVTDLEDGVLTVTESDDPAVAARIVDHVTAMKLRMEEGRRIRQWDPIYVAMFDDAEKVRIDIEPTGKGVRVRETASDAKTVRLIKEHAKVVTGFVTRGFEESRVAHPAPPD